MGELTPADVAAMNGGGGFGNEGLWLFAILALMGGGFGNWNNRGNDYPRDYVTSSQFQDGLNLNDLQSQNRDILTSNSNQTRDILQAIKDSAYGVNSTVKDSAYNNLSELRDIQSMIERNQANTTQCCCNTQKEILENRYLAERNSNAITAAIHADGEETRKMIYQNKFDAMQSRINSLELKLATAGTVKYPTETSHCVPSPCFGGC